MRGALEYIRGRIHNKDYGDYESPIIYPRSRSPPSPAPPSESSEATGSPSEGSHSISRTYSAADKVLSSLLANDRFLARLVLVCEANQVTENHVRPAIEGLYHTVSKYAHGYDRDTLVIDRRDLSPNEVIALGMLFRLYKINFIYRDREGCETEFPYAA